MLRTPRLVLSALAATALLVTGLAVGPPAAHAGAQTFYVSPSGSDSNPGTAAQPWRNINTAAQRTGIVGPGDTVVVRGGTYKEIVEVKVSGTASAPITFMEQPGENVVITGAGRDVIGERGLINIRNQSHVVVDGFELTDLTGLEHDADTPAGVWVQGSTVGVTLQNLEIHDINAAGYDGGRVGNAHGIAVYGTGGTPASRITILDNHVHDLRLGTSEAIVVNGNVAGWAIRDNIVEQVDNIAIDAIGGEKTFGGVPGKDQARNGIISGNTIDGVDTAGNPGYENCSCAAGIYVDGGRDIIVQRNRVSRSDLGIEVGAENRRAATTGILIRNNLVEDSQQSGLTLGGYEEDRGSVRDVQVVNNTFVEPDNLRKDYGLVYLNHNLSQVRMVNNVFAISLGGKLVTGYAKDTGRISFAGNRWFAAARSAGATLWLLRGRDIRGYKAWKRITGETKGSYGAPGLGPDRVPETGSALINRGTGALEAGPVDLAGNPRKVGVIDIGAFEVQ